MGAVFSIVVLPIQVECTEKSWLQAFQEMAFFLHKMPLGKSSRWSFSFLISLPQMFKKIELLLDDNSKHVNKCFFFFFLVFKIPHKMKLASSRLGSILMMFVEREI